MQLQETMNTAQCGKKWLALLLAVVLVFGGTFPLALAPTRAYAETTDIEAEADSAQQKVEESAAAYDSAVARVSELESQISDNEARIDELEEELPEQQSKAASAYRAIYKMQQEAPGLLELIISSKSFSEFLDNVAYVTHIQDSKQAEINRLQNMQGELNQTRTDLSNAKKEAVEQQEQAEQALSEAQAAREEAQRKAQEKAAAEAAEAAAAASRAAANKASQQGASSGSTAGGAAAGAANSASGTNKAATSENASQGSDTTDDQTATATDAAESTDGNQAAATDTTTDTGTVETPSNDGADWSSDRDVFVSTWASRIDAYLAGSAMAGTGTIFAEAAWDYGVDPRWSPAIAYTESSLGSACFLPYNAWGWGSVSFSSWDDAIRTHVAGLARGYGYTISVTAAQKYCPPNWEHWYNVTSGQMSMI